MNANSKKDLRFIASEMRRVSNAFYAAAIRIENHPFIEFCGLMNEYINACEAAAAKGVDFTECNTHTGLHLPLEPHQIAHINEKLECIFTGRSVMNPDDAIKAERVECIDDCNAEMSVDGVAQRIIDRINARGVA